MLCPGIPFLSGTLSKFSYTLCLITPLISAIPPIVPSNTVLEGLQVLIFCLALKFPSVSNTCPFIASCSFITLSQPAIGVPILYISFAFAVWSNS